MSLAFTNFLSGTTSYRLSDGVPILKDYQHAARFYADSNYARIPKFGFIYFVEININSDAIIESSWKAQGKYTEVGLLAKKVDLPKFSIATETLNQYNRKTVVQSKLTYQPTSIDFHDDASNITHNLWVSYYKHYYADSNYGDPRISKLSKGSNPESFADTKYSKDDFVYGRYARPVTQFLSSINIYVLFKHQFTQYTLINPKITEWAHDSVSQGDGTKVLQNRMTVAYENVLYNQGDIQQGKDPEGWVPIFYDNNPSPYSIAGNQNNQPSYVRQQSSFDNPGKERVFGSVGGRQPISPINQTVYGNNGGRFEAPVKNSTKGGQSGTFFGNNSSRAYGQMGGTPPMSPTAQLVSILAKNVVNKRALGKLGPVGYTIASGVLANVLGKGTGKYSDPPPTQNQPGILKLPGGIGINIFKGINRSVDGKIRGNPAAILFPRRK